MISKNIFYSVLACLFLLSAASQAVSQEDFIKERKSLMRSNDRTVKAIRKAVKQDDFAAIEASAKLIVADMDKLLALFPKGSTSEKSRAKAEIWEDWDSFSKKSLAAKTAAEELAKIAAAKDSEQLGPKIKALGTSRAGACGSCHMTFRARSKRKR